MKPQTKMMSFIEALAGTFVGLFIAFGAQHYLFKWYNLPVDNVVNAWIVFWMTIISVIRTYVMRRIFNKVFR